MGYSYKEAGVDIKKADEFVSIIKNIVKAPQMGGFAGIFEHPIFDDYYICACTDGVGTKVLPLIDRRDAKTVANDLVAMNLNDLICTGAKPLFFLDYIAANSLDIEFLSDFVKNLNQILSCYNCVLLGGETSELGDLILKKYFDFSGFLVGAVKKEDYINKNNVKKGDVVIGLKSSGAHSNGFSLLRKLYFDGKLDEKIFNDALKPVKIYYDIMQILVKNKLVKSAANITGGGILANLKRAVPDDLKISLDFKKIPQMPLFKKVLEFVDTDEAYRTLNMGVGFCVIASSDCVDEILRLAAAFDPFVFGEIL